MNKFYLLGTWFLIIFTGLMCAFYSGGWKIYYKVKFSAPLSNEVRNEFLGYMYANVPKDKLTIKNGWGDTVDYISISGLIDTPNKPEPSIHRVIVEIQSTDILSLSAWGSKKAFAYSVRDLLEECRLFIIANRKLELLKSKKVFQDKAKELIAKQKTIQNQNSEVEANAEDLRKLEKSLHQLNLEIKDLAKSYSQIDQPFSVLYYSGPKWGLLNERVKVPFALIGAIFFLVLSLLTKNAIEEWRNEKCQSG